MGLDDIADIRELDLGGVTVPDDAGVLFIFSHGWRKGMYYDFGPLQEDSRRRTTNLREVFGQYFLHLVFQERFGISEDEWTKLFAVQWFPFVGLRHDTVNTLLAHLRTGWDVDELVPRIAQELKDKLPNRRASWRTHPVFATHVDILDKAVERFLAGDNVSSTGLIFPRIEGILRSDHARIGMAGRATQAALCTSAVRAHANRDRSLLLPRMFQRYLEEVYFAEFDPNDATIGISRNSVGHGVASAAHFSEKAAAIGFLVVEQLFFCLQKGGGATSSTTSAPANDSQLQSTA